MAKKLKYPAHHRWKLQQQHQEQQQQQPVVVKLPAVIDDSLQKRKQVLLAENSTAKLIDQSDCSSVDSGNVKRRDADIFDHNKKLQKVDWYH